MKTKQLDSLFFKVFTDVCQTKAVYGYTSEEKLADRTLSVKTGVGLDGYKDKIIKDILTVAMLTLEKEKKINYEKFELLSKSILMNYLKKKSNDILNETGKNGRTKKEELIIEIESSLYKIYSMIEPSDFEGVIKRYTRNRVILNNYVYPITKAYFKLGRKYQFKKQYEYLLEYQFLRKHDTQFDIIKITSENITNEELYFSQDLNLLTWYLKKAKTGSTFRYYIIYDTIALKRTVVPFQMVKGSELRENFFVALFQTDTNSFYKRIGEHCKDKKKKNVCFGALFSTQVRKIFHEEKEPRRTVGENLEFMKKKVKELRTSKKVLIKEVVNKENE